MERNTLSSKKNDLGKQEAVRRVGARKALVHNRLWCGTVAVRDHVTPEEDGSNNRIHVSKVSIVELTNQGLAQHAKRHIHGQLPRSRHVSEVQHAPG